MSKPDATAENQDVDEHGLVIHTYESTVLVVLPPRAYAETTMRYARSALYNVHVGTRVVSTDDGELVHGELQDELQPDGLIRDANMDDYEGLILCGGPGAEDLAQNAEVRRLLEQAFAQDKLVAAWGQAAAVLAGCSAIKGRKVTGDRAAKASLEAAGARYTGTQIQVDGKLVTALDDAAGFRFGKALVQVVAI